MMSGDYTKKGTKEEIFSELLLLNIFNYEKTQRLNENFIGDYLNILYIDAICLNIDRHTYNYGF